MSHPISRPKTGRIVRRARGFAGLVLAACLASPACGATAIDSLSDRIRQNLHQDHVYSTLVEQYVQLQDKDGLFTDLTYSSTSLTNWSPVAHPTRILMWAKAYTKPDCPYRGADTLLGRIKLGMDAYLVRNPTSKNWWYNDVGEDLPWGQILILLRGSVPDSTLSRWAERISGRWMSYTGANLLWEGGAHVYKCLAQNRLSGVDSVFARFREEFELVDEGDGIHRDFSFGQHASRRHFVYNGGYGQNYLDEAVDWVNIVRGLRWEFTGSAKAHLDSLVVRGSAWMIHKNRWDPTVLGRTVTRLGTPWADALKVSASLLEGNDSLGPLDSVQRYLDGRLEWFQNPDKLFWTCGYLAHHGPGWMTSLRAPREDETATESGNGEGLLDWYLGYGSHWVRVWGGEYDSIWPVFDWSSVPGVTNDHPDTLPGLGLKNGFGYNYGTTDFVGGVSDGRATAFAYDYYISEIRGKKAWFQTEDALIGLGAGFLYDLPDTVSTTIDQKWLHGPLKVVNRTGQDLAMGGDTILRRDLSWIHHDSVGYWFPQSGDLELRTPARSGSWRTISMQNPDHPVSGKLFQLRLMQGTSEESGSFAYGIVPGVSADSMQSWVRRAPVRIESNTRRVQAVSEGDWKGMVFHAAPDTVRFSDGTEVAVDRPSVLVTRKTESGLRVRAASPDRDYGTLNVSVRTKDGWNHFAMWLPERSLLGSPVEHFSSWVPPAGGCPSQRVSHRVVWRGERAVVQEIGPNHEAFLVSLDGRIHGRWQTMENGELLRGASPGMWLRYKDDQDCACRMWIPPK